MRPQSSDFPKHIWINVPKGRMWSMGKQIFSTDDLPEKLLSTFVALEEVDWLWRRNFLLKYAVEPIFSLEIPRVEKKYGNKYFDVESINKLCNLIFQPFFGQVRSAVPQDQFVEENTGEKPYWLYTPTDKSHLMYSQNGVIWETSILDCEAGYYYQISKSRDDSRIKKVGSEELLEKELRAVKPVIFFDAREFLKSKDVNLAYV